MGKEKVIVHLVWRAHMANILTEISPPLITHSRPFTQQRLEVNQKNILHLAEGFLGNDAAKIHLVFCKTLVCRICIRPEQKNTQDTFKLVCTVQRWKKYSGHVLK